MLNKNLIKQQNLSPAKVKQIEKLHRKLGKLLSNKCKLSNTDLIDAIEGLEYKLQELWGFPQDRNFHRYWCRSYRCSCPKMDNDDMVGTEYRIYGDGCKLHGMNN